MGEKDSQLCLLSVTWRLERNSEPKSLNLAGGENYDVWPSRRPPLSISLSTADDDQVWFFFTSSRSDHERGPFMLPFPLLSFLLRQQREQNRTTSGSVFNEEGEGSHATDRLLLAKIRTAAAIFDNQLRRLRARLLNGKPNRKREKLHGSFEQADGSLTFGNCTKTLVVPRASELIPRCHSQTILRCIGIAFMLSQGEKVSFYFGTVLLGERVGKESQVKKVALCHCRCGSGKKGGWIARRPRTK